MAINISIDNDRLTVASDGLILDESLNVQTPITADDGNDIDVTLSAPVGGLLGGFVSAFNTLLNGLPLIDAQKVYASTNDGASSLSDFVKVTTSAGETISSLFFSDSAGNALNGDQVMIDHDGNPLTPRIAMTTLDGSNVYLWTDGSFGSTPDFCVATTSSTAGAGRVVAAFYLNEAADHKTAQVQMVTFEPLNHPNATNPDDSVDFSDVLQVTANGTTSFDFDNLESGNFLWVAIGSRSAGLLVTGQDLNVIDLVSKQGDVIKGGSSDPSDTINTSQGGINATIGVNSQHFVGGPKVNGQSTNGPVAVFTLVKDFERLTGVDQATGINVKEIDYGDYINSAGAALFISQVTSGVPTKMLISLWEAGGGNATDHSTATLVPEEGYTGANSYIGDQDLDSHLRDDTPVNVASVNIGALTWLYTEANIGTTGVTKGGITVKIDGNDITVTGVPVGTTIHFTAIDDPGSAVDGTFNRFTVQGLAGTGAFDIGRIDLDQGVSVHQAVGNSLFVDDDGPSVDLVLNGAAEVTVDESTLPASDSILASVLFTTNTAAFGTDGAGTDASVYKLLLADDNSGLIDTLTLDEVLLDINSAGTLIIGSVNGGADEVFRIALDPDTGQLTLTQKRALFNDDPTDSDESGDPLTLPTGLVEIQRTLTDGDDDSASDHVDISAIFKFEDDGPVLAPPSADPLTFVTDDTDIADLATLSTDDIFPTPPDFGSDEANAIDPMDFELRLNPDVSHDSGLVDTATGKSVLLVDVGDDIVGFVDADGNGSIGAGETLEAVRYSLTAVDVDTDTVTFTQSRSVVHADPNDPDEDPDDADFPLRIANNLVLLDQVAYDGDNDVSDVVSFDLGAITFIKDDGPTIGPIANSIVDFALNDSANEDLNGVVGNDTKTSPYTLTGYTASLTVNGVDLHAVTSGDATVGYWADTNVDTIFGNQGDTEYYRLVLGDQAGEGDYTFTVLVNPPASNKEFLFDDLPSGSNLFGIVGDADAGLVIFGKTIGLKADNTFISNQTQEVKTSQAGLHATIGVESQMFDPGDAAYFTFVNDPDPNFTGTGLGSTEADDADNIHYGSTLEGDSAFIRVAQLQGNTAPSMSIQLFNIDDSPQGVAMLNARGINAAGTDPDITDVRVYAADGTTLLESYSGGVEAGLSSTITISINGAGVATVTGFGTNNKIEWDADEDFDQTLITGVGGKFDIGGFGFTQGNDTPDQLLEFTAKVTDGDGDTDGGGVLAYASWKIGIDGTGIYDDNLVSGVII